MEGGLEDSLDLMGSGIFISDDYDDDGKYDEKMMMKMMMTMAMMRWF